MSRRIRREYVVVGNSKEKAVTTFSMRAALVAARCERAGQQQVHVVRRDTYAYPPVTRNP